MDQREQYEQYLKILSIFHYVVGGISALFACFPLLHFIVGIVFFVLGLVPSSEGSGLPFFPATLFGFFFAAIAGSMILLGWAFAICTMIAGYSLAAKKRYTFCLVMAGIACAFPPFGTVLGVFTIITLMQPLVKEMFPFGQTVQSDA